MPVSLQLLAINHRRWLASASVDVRSASLVVKVVVVVVVGGALRVQATTSHSWMRREMLEGKCDGSQRGGAPSSPLRRSDGS